MQSLVVLPGSPDPGQGSRSAGTVVTDRNRLRNNGGWARAASPRAHGPRVPYCYACQGALESPSELLQHLRLHVERPRAFKQCPACLVTFLHGRGLAAHLARHHGVTLLPCPYCPSTFYSHHDRDRWGCAVCRIWAVALVCGCCM